MTKHTDDLGVGRAMRELADEPLLPVEKKLIAWSVGLGIVLLGVLIWLSRTYFPTP